MLVLLHLLMMMTYDETVLFVEQMYLDFSLSKKRNKTIEQN